MRVTDNDNVQLLMFDLGNGIVIRNGNEIVISKPDTEMDVLPIGEYPFKLKRNHLGLNKTIISGLLLVNP